MKKSLFLLLINIVVDFANANLCGASATRNSANLVCANGQCIISGDGNCAVSSINADTLIVRNISGTPNAHNKIVLTIRVGDTSTNKINKLIIDSSGTSSGRVTEFWITSSSGTSYRAKLEVGSVEKGNNAGNNPPEVFLEGNSSLTNKDGTDNIKVLVGGVTIQKPGRGNTSSSG
ncbi:hypothetical protein, partial [Helicobacter sp. T3_23-1056]